MQEKQKAFLFDLNGTIIDDMHYHLKAWYEILTKDLGADLSWEEVKSHMYGKNQELLVRVFGNERFTMEQMDYLSVEKEKRYQAAYKPYLQLINGLEPFLQAAHEKGIKMAIGSAAILFNVDFVLDGLHIRKYFTSVICADNVETSKPHPETFLKAAEETGVDPARCIVFEDAPKGVEAALNAGMKAVVLTTMHTEDEFQQYPNIIKFITDYTDPSLQELLS
jgi:beta-phosphoglucomutase family hydrolase